MQKSNMMNEDYSIYGVLPKNICVNLTGCRDPESCIRRQRMHPKWAVELKVCTFHISGLNKCKNPKCRFNHEDWENLRSNEKINAENSRDYFTNKSISEILESFDGFKWNADEVKVGKTKDIEISIDNSSDSSAVSTNENGSQIDFGFT